MRAITPEEIDQIVGGLRMTPTARTKSGYPVESLPGPTVSASPYPSYTSPWRWAAGPPSDPSGPSQPSGPSSGGAGDPPDLGNFNLCPPIDTTDHRRDVVTEAEAILRELGYYMPPGVTVAYDDVYVAENAQGKYPLHDLSQAESDGVKLDFGWENASNGRIIITKDNMSNLDALWIYLTDDDGTPSITGTHQQRAIEAGVTPLEHTIATLAHEYYHAQVVNTYGITYYETHKDAFTDQAETYGYMALQAYLKATHGGSKCGC